ncbi:MAG: inositol monophosphatase [Bacteroidales bacterium]|jgi:myo-inositol-1(or 4)-monophosphatase|nr:inositol monophosphatase [Bacteroidales bacterium]
MENILQNVIELVREAGKFIKEQNARVTAADVELKGAHDYVTYVDKNTEKILVDGLSCILPEAGFITEEGTSSVCGKKYNWIIDPLDGTTNFIHKVPFYCISVGLEQVSDLQDNGGLQNVHAKSHLAVSGSQSNLVLGVIYHIDMDEMFYSCKGLPAYLNGTQIKVSNTPNLDRSLLATGFPYHDYERLGEYMKFLEYTMLHSSGLRRLGSAALDLAYVACGRCDVFYEYGLSAWDVAAGAFLVQQAGGRVSDFKGGTNFLHGREIIATNYNVYNEFLNSFTQFVPSKL